MRAPAVSGGSAIQSWPDRQGLRVHEIRATMISRRLLRRGSRMTSRPAALLPAWIGALLTAIVAASETKPADEPIIVPLEKVSAFKESQDQPNLSLVRGHLMSCQTQPAGEVKTYPRLKSSKPLYGEAEFDRNYFDRKPGIKFAFVIDESGGTGKGYDRLYFDDDQDRDLTNHPVVKPMKDPPEWRRYKGRELRETIFDHVTVDLDYGPPTGKLSLSLMPRLNVWDSGHADLCFILPDARKGELQVGKRRFRVFLSQTYFISGRYDRAMTQMALLPTEGEREFASWWGSDRLGAMHVFDGRLYQFSTTPLGDKLIVQPYKGDLGVLRIGAGGRKLDKATMRGSIGSQTHWLATGPLEEGGWPKDSTEVSLPVGDYTADLLNFQMGRLRIEVSHNYHSDGSARERQRDIVYGIKIRKDRPFVLDFSNKPEVLFASPARDQILHPGEELKVNGVLIDPALDIMIRGLTDTTRKQKKEYTNSDGSKSGWEQDLSLDPTVVITDAAGKRLAEGVMPFG